MRFFSVSLLLVFLSLALFKSYSQAQVVGYFCEGPSVSVENSNENTVFANFNTYNTLRVNKSDHTFKYTDNLLSNTASATLSTDKTSAERGALIGGITGFVVGGIYAGIKNSESNLFVSTIDLLTGEDVSSELFEEQVPYIVIGTLAGVGIGALIGKRRDRVTIRNKEFLIDFQPVFATTPASTNEMVFALNFSMRY